MGKVIDNKFIAFMLILIILVWIGGWIYATLPEVKEFSSQPIGDIFNSINALFAGLAFFGIILTIHLQMEELKDTRKELAATAASNEIIASESKEKAILDLYQTFCSSHFQTIKTSSFNVMISAVQNKQYCDFMISRFFVISDEKITIEILKILPIYKKIIDEDSTQNLIEKEQFDRFRLDELINFFILLANKNESKEIIHNCDFFYDWWRPLFWFLSQLQLEYYNSSMEVQKYSKKPYLRVVVEKLDDIYGWEIFKSSDEVWKYILNHPKIIGYGIAPELLKKRVSCSGEQISNL